MRLCNAASRTTPHTVVTVSGDPRFESGHCSLARLAGRINNLPTNIDRCQPAFNEQHCVNKGPRAGGF